MKILIIKQTSLGDLIHSTLAVEAIRAQYPDAEIDFMVDRSCSFAIEHNPHINKFYLFDKRQLKLIKSAPLKLFSYLRGIVKEMRQTRYDLAFDLQGIERSAFFLYACRANKKFIKKTSYPFLKGFKNADKNHHALAELRGVLNLAGIECEKFFPRIYQSQASREELVKKLPTQFSKAYQGQESPLIIISPFTSWETKDVPLKTYRDAAIDLLKQFPRAHFVFSATPDKKEEIDLFLQESCKNFPILADCMLNFAGQTSIQEMISLIDGADLVWASEGAAGHISCAVETPVCVIFGPTLPSRVGPWTPESAVIQAQDVACLGCYQRQCDDRICMEFPIEQLTAASFKFLATYAK